MQPLRIHMQPDDYKRAARRAQDENLSFSEFVRRAVAEKLDHRVHAQQMQDLATAMADHLAQIRAEQHIQRQELADEAAKVIEVARREIEQSHRRIEALVKTLLTEIAKAVDGKPATTGPRSTATTSNDLPPI